MTASIEHGTISARKHHNCTCFTCRANYSEYQRDVYRQQCYGTWQPYIDPQPTLDHIAALRAAGMGAARIARVAGISDYTVSRLLRPLGNRPQTARMRPETAAKILAVKPDQLADGTQINAAGTRRRLQALQAVGWPQKILAERLGLAERKVWGLLFANKVFLRTSRNVAALYDEIWDQIPEQSGVQPTYAKRARASAERRGWVVPLAWDDKTIDDPEAQPDPEGLHGLRATVEERQAARDALMDDAKALLLRGYTAEIVAQRVGVSERTVDRWSSAEGWRRPL